MIADATSAQHSESPRGFVNLGVKGGVNMYNVHNDNNTQFDQITGYYFGLFGHIHLKALLLSSLYLNPNSANQKFSCRHFFLIMKQSARTKGQSGSSEKALKSFYARQLKKTPQITPSTILSLLPTLKKSVKFNNKL